MVCPRASYVFDQRSVAPRGSCHSGWGALFRADLGNAPPRTATDYGQDNGKVDGNKPGGSETLMPISGTLLNVLAVLIGGTLGLLVGGRLPDRSEERRVGKAQSDRK